ncbi:trypsin domain-containing protein [Ditylenchus destructor]|uniref:Trypsin domain-containing protein n=1 Tax=Ditylenchus destructor TaxID=166010 RepID=A0AAD4R8A8_9BILA|nr:trypsin domain-containing protein [Ditylenchus destructor]
MSALNIIHLLIFAFLYKTSAVLDGDDVRWIRHRWIVKVMAKNPEGNAHSCTGSMISQSLVLTAAECVVQRSTRARMEEFVVILPKVGSHKRHFGELSVGTTKIAQYKFSEGHLLELSQEWALLRIQPLDINDICPKEDRDLKGILRLNLKPSLLAPSLFEVTPATIKESDCYLYGFETTENAIGFLKQKILRRIDMEKPVDHPENEGYLRSRIIGNNTACFEDTGAALICRVHQHGFLHVGIFQSLSFPQSDVNQNFNRTSMNMCYAAHSMEFSINTADEQLVEAINRYALAEFVAVYAACEFI